MLGAIHTMWKPLPGRFKDYISVPKTNMYQSLHTTVLSSYGSPFEIQIRTHEMHRIAEYGIAAHWKYKQGLTGGEPTTLDENKLAWIRSVMELQNDVSDSKEYLDMLKLDLYVDQVFVFTPKGDVFNLPAGSTGIDFAYAVHSQVGNKCVGIKINSKMVPVDTDAAKRRRRRGDHVVDLEGTVQRLAQIRQDAFGEEQDQELLQEGDARGQHQARQGYARRRRQAQGLVRGGADRQTSNGAITSARSTTSPTSTRCSRWSATAN